MEKSAAWVEEQIAAASRIKKHDLLIVVSLSFALAILSTLARIALKFHHRHPFGIDDYFIFFGVMCLIASMGPFYCELDNFYLAAAILNDPSLVYSLPPSRVQDLIDSGMNKYIYATMCLLWTTTFCVKFSFLAFFKRIAKPLPKARWLWGATIVVCVLVWVYMMLDPFLACPYFDRESFKCYGPGFDKRFQILTYLGTVLDILTDLMIISIPILVLRHAQIACRQKAAIAAFLSLSIIMIVIAIVRVSNIHGKVPQSADSPWLMFWSHIEAVVAVIMVSLTAFRTVFALQRTERKRQERMKWSRDTWPSARKFYRRSGVSVDGEMSAGLPQVPSARLIGMRTAIRETGTDMIDERMVDKPGPLDLAKSKTVGSTASMEINPWVTSPTWLKFERRSSDEESEAAC